ncbi:hypothetical protein A3J91_00105 [Candidatus Peribacteria bacterium RIFOXYC2_FULL_58_10]|nr:MAG: hypothetical protein A3J91_00105 [Candidatus Peribacteria bacterium RIFOXYC2_FULL_58_10]
MNQWAALYLSPFKAKSFKYCCGTKIEQFGESKMPWKLACSALFVRDFQSHKKYHPTNIAASNNSSSDSKLSSRTRGRVLEQFFVLRIRTMLQRLLRLCMKRCNRCKET